MGNGPASDPDEWCHLAVGVDAGVDQALQDELGKFILQSHHCGVEGLGHLSHVCRHVWAEILDTEHKQHL